MVSIHLLSSLDKEPPNILLIQCLVHQIEQLPSEPLKLSVAVYLMFHDYLFLLGGQNLLTVSLGWRTDAKKRKRETDHH